MPTLQVDPSVVRRALYEAVAENVPAQHGAFLMALEKGVRFGRALNAQGELGKRARKALPAVQALAAGKMSLAQSRAISRKLGFKPDTIRDAAAALKIRNDPGEVARAVCSVAAQIEASPSIAKVEVGSVWSRVKKGFQKVTKGAHKITHSGPIAQIERKLQDTVSKALPITKPFINVHKKITSVFTQKVLAKAGLIGSKKSGKKPSIKAAARAAFNRPMAPSASRQAAPQPSRADPSIKRARVRGKSGRVYEVAVRRAS